MRRGVLRTIKKREEIRNTKKGEKRPSGDADRFKHKEGSFTGGGVLYGSLCCRDCGGVGPLLAPTLIKTQGADKQEGQVH